tara:strand:- start:128 stop:1204 length:1077 start_codon:yes stop_codon:yes gene_type:complete
MKLKDIYQKTLRAVKEEDVIEDLCDRLNKEVEDDDDVKKMSKLTRTMNDYGEMKKMCKVKDGMLEGTKSLKKSMVKEALAEFSSDDDSDDDDFFDDDDDDSDDDDIDLYTGWTNFPFSTATGLLGLSSTGGYIFAPKEARKLLKMNYSDTAHFLNQFPYDDDQTLGQRLEDLRNNHMGGALGLNHIEIAQSVHDIVNKLPHEVVFPAARAVKMRIDKWLRLFAVRLIKLLRRGNMLGDTRASLMFGHSLGVHSMTFPHNNNLDSFKERTRENIKEKLGKKPNNAKALKFLEKLREGEFIDAVIDKQLKGLLTDNIENAYGRLAFDAAIHKMLIQPYLVAAVKYQIRLLARQVGYSFTN